MSRKGKEVIFDRFLAWRHIYYFHCIKHRWYWWWYSCHYFTFIIFIDFSFRALMLKAHFLRHKISATSLLALPFIKRRGVELLRFLAAFVSSTIRKRHLFACSDWKPYFTQLHSVHSKMLKQSPHQQNKSQKTAYWPAGLWFMRAEAYPRQYTSPSILL